MFSICFIKQPFKNNKKYKFIDFNYIYSNINSILTYIRVKNKKHSQLNKYVAVKTTDSTSQAYFTKVYNSLDNVQACQESTVLNSQ